MGNDDLRFTSREAHRAWLSAQSELPRGFSIGRAPLQFVSETLQKPAAMTLTLLSLERPTPAFGAVFTRNAFPGAPVLVGRRRLAEESLGAVLINNKVSNVCAPNGEADAELLCGKLGQALGLRPEQVLPCSTGVIGWRLPVEPMTAALPALVTSRQNQTILPAAEGICTTDLFPKVRRVSVEGGQLVGIAKGAGMVEPNLATMLVFLLTDLWLERDELRAALTEATDATFNCMSVDSDTSTSDTVALLSSQAGPRPSRLAFRHALQEVCGKLAEDIIRNGEGVHHAIRVTVTGAADTAMARGVGKAVVNSPLFQCAVNGNDPNVGRLVMAVGKFLGAQGVPLSPERCHFRMGGQTIFEHGAFRLDAEVERKLVAHLRDAELYQSQAPADGLTFRPPIDYPPHERFVEVELSLGLGRASATILGADRSHEYISENADYRS